MNPWTPLIAATFGWAASIVLTRAVLQDGVDTFALLPARMSFALVTLAVVTIFMRRFLTRDREAWMKGGLLGLFGMSFPMAVMTLALEYIPVSIHGLLIALIPITTIVAAHFFVDGERFQPRSLPGLLVALVGSGVLVGVGGEVEGVTDLWLGVSLVVIGVAMAGLAGALSRRFALQIKAEKLVIPQFTVATMTMFVIMPFFVSGSISSWSGEAWFLIFLVGSVGTTLPFAAFLLGAEVNPASRLALTGYSVPVVAVAMAVLFLGEQLTLPILIGAVLIIGGVILAERSTPHVPEPGVITSR